MANDAQDPSSAGGGRFTTTHWSLVLAAAGNEDARGREALASLCKVYWYPLYAFVRRQGHDPHDAQDLTQEFFLRLLDKDYLGDVDRSKGKFRSFLLVALKHFLSKHWARAKTLKRGGGGRALLPLDSLSAEDRYRREPEDNAITRLMPTEEADPAVVGAVFDELEEQALRELPGAGDLMVRRAVDARFRGQAHQLTVPAPAGPVTAASIAEIERAFFDRYRDAYGIDLDAPTELVDFRVRVSRTVEKLTPVPHRARATTTPDPSGERAVGFAAPELVPCPVFSWERLAPGSRLVGPAVIEGYDTTVVIPPWHSVETDRWWNLLIHPVSE